MQIDSSTMGALTATKPGATAQPKGGDEVEKTTKAATTDDGATKAAPSGGRGQKLDISV